MSDLIDRQAAIDALDRIFDRCEEIEAHLPEGDPDRTGYKMYPDYMTVWKYLHQLSSAQPEIIRCKDCKYAEYIDDVQTLWCTECGQGRTVAPNDFCSYAERRDDEVTCDNCEYSEKYVDGLILCKRTKTSHRVSATSTCGKGKREERK